MSDGDPGPQVDETGVVLRVPDTARALTSVRLHQEVVRPRDGPELDWHEHEASWTVRFPRHDVDRLEYVLERRHRDGGVEIGPDPLNPRRVPGPFGERSVVEYPGYVAPSWRGGERPPRGGRTETALRSRLLRTEVPATIWSAPGTDPREPLPLLVVHDGPDYVAYADLLVLLERHVADGSLPPHRAALLAAVDRDETYSASPLYARALTDELLPVLDQLAPTRPERHAWVGMGASLGALAMLAAHRLRPDAFGGLFLQSGSFFHLHADRHEGRFRRYGRVRRFVEDLVHGRGPRDPITVAMTVGAREENRANNRAVHDALVHQGYAVRLHEGRDVHTWTAWRDLLDPPLVALLRRLWASPG